MKNTADLKHYAVRQVDDSKFYPPEIDIKLPKNNKLRLVYRVNKYGTVLSHAYISKPEALRIFKIRQCLRDVGNHYKNRWVPIHRIVKVTKIKYGTLVRTILKTTGAIYADMGMHGGYQTIISSPLFDIRNRMFNSRANANKSLAYLKAPYLVRIPLIPRQ